MKANRAALAIAQMMAMAGTVGHAVAVNGYDKPSIQAPTAHEDYPCCSGTTRNANRGKYTPHTGLQEQLRRRSQREAGTLNVYPGGWLHA